MRRGGGSPAQLEEKLAVQECHASTRSFSGGQIFRNGAGPPRSVPAIAYAC